MKRVFLRCSTIYTVTWYKNVTKSDGTMGNTIAPQSGDPAFKTRSGDWLICCNTSVVSPSTIMPRWTLGLDADCLLPRP
jgi:hypothetical protein